MIRMIQSVSPDQAKDYFNSALAKSDYYHSDQELPGQFKGLLAQRLNLDPNANKEQFYQLCDNINPATGGNLTPRNVANRTVGYDINFHACKSASILMALSKDDHILEAFQKSVSATMEEIEADSMTRVRKKGKDFDRPSGELAWGEFYHLTSRATKGHLPDPHLHCHAFVFNASYCEVENEIKAAQFRYIKRDMPYYEARFHKRFADSLIDLGYQVRKSGKSFEVVGVPDSVIKCFSKRKNEVAAYAKEHGINDPTELDQLGARTRSKKNRDITMEDLKVDWKRQIRELDPDLSEGDKAVRFAPDRVIEKEYAQQSIDYAKHHSFERASVVRDRRLLEAAYRHATTKRSISLEEIDTCFDQQADIIKVQDNHHAKCTTIPVLKEEQEMIDMALAGKNRFRPLYTEIPELTLNKQQNAALTHILTTRHQVSIVRGAAGTGKTTMMSEAKRLINERGLKLFVVAPTAQASRGVLVQEGFEDAETVSRLLIDPTFQEKLKGQVLWVDEAGLLGTREAKAILEIAKKNNTRVIYGGDARQHSAVTRGDALRILNTVGQIASAEVTKIYRQQHEQYRAAVYDLSQAKVKDAFEKLDNMGAIVQVDPLKPNEQLIQDYLKFKKEKKSILVVSPTHEQGRSVTDEIRKGLKTERIIGKTDKEISKLTNLNFTEAQKRDWRLFEASQIIEFTQNINGFKKGSSWQIKSVENKSVTISDGNKTKTLPLDRAEHFSVFRHDKMEIAKGDQVRITKNCYDGDKKRFTNGQSLEVVDINKSGDIRLISKQNKSVYRINKDFGHIDHDYCSTSYSAQGKTVDRVLVSQPSSTFPATDAKQFYVSLSRGKFSAHLYTDDKEALLERASELGERLSATELVGKSNTADYALHLDRVTQYNQPQPNNINPIKSNRKLEDYEPGL